MSSERFVVPPDQDSLKLDRLVAQHASVSRRIARMWIAAGRVQVNRKVVRILTRPIRAGATISLHKDAPVEEPPADSHPPVTILHLDRWVVAVNKPAKLLSEHDRFGSPSLESVVPPLLQARGEHPRLWLVHRLDAGTSGVMVLARTPSAAAALSEAFRQKTAHKVYLALCSGVLTKSIRIDAPLAQSTHRTRQEVTQEGKSAQTRVIPLAEGRGACLVRAEPRTGRTHQIRVHLQHVGHPLLGDRLYDGPVYTQDTPPASIGRPMLHAQELVLPHPKTGAPLQLKAAPPTDFRDTAAAFGIEYAWQ